MRTQTPSISTHRLARLNAWARLWLVRFVGVIAVWWSGGGRMHARDLDRVARMARNVILANAGARYRSRGRSNNRHGRLKRWGLRTIAGSALTRALRGADAPSRLHAILTVLRDAEFHIARLLRRLRRGLTRLRVILPQRCTDALDDAPTHALACADTS